MRKGKMPEQIFIGATGKRNKVRMRQVVLIITKYVSGVPVECSILHNPNEATIPDGADLAIAYMPEYMFGDTK